MIRLAVAGFLLVSVAACQPGVNGDLRTPAPTNTEDLMSEFAEFTPIPTVALVTETPEATRIIPTPIPSATNLPTRAPSPTQTMTATVSVPPIVQEKTDHYWLDRPIAQMDDYIHWIDRTYPYGGTQFGTREVHLGVEFVNGRFTPVYAAGEGVVIFAENDQGIQFGPRRDYYGNLVVIEHALHTVDHKTVYSLYAHLQDIEVQSGQHVRAGQLIGRVGDSGIAVGPHLHFEVRVGDPYDYRTTRNPDLWIKPYAGFGTLAGALGGVDDPAGIVLHIRSETVQRETYVYGGMDVNSDVAWQENFTLGDLPSGDYEVTVSNGAGRILFRDYVPILSGKTSFVEVDLSGNGV